MDSSESVYALSDEERRFLDSVQQHYNLLATEAKKKHPHIKEACETGIIRVRNASSSKMVAGMGGLRQSFQAESQQILEPFFMACDTKILKMIQISMSAIQKLILFQSIDKKASSNLLHCLWALMEHGLEEVKILQTITLLVSASSLVTDEQLSRIICLCFRLSLSKDPIIKNTSLATIRQVITVIFERIQKDDKATNTSSSALNDSSTKSSSYLPPKVEDCFKTDEKDGEKSQQSRCYKPVNLKSYALDGFNFLQDLIQIINDEPTFWLKDLHVEEGMKTFMLELLELILDHYDSIFRNHVEFGFLLKERICQLVIKLFSPSLKQRGSFSAIFNPILKPNLNQAQESENPVVSSSPEWPITVRLMRIVSVLIKKFFNILETENEIFFTLLVKSLEVDKQNWQRSIALEALYRMIHPELIKTICKCYDMENSKILRDIVNALCVYIQSQFQVVDSSTTQSLMTSLVNNTNSGTSNQFSGSGSHSGTGLGNGPGTMNSSGSLRNGNFTFPTFNLRGVSLRLNFIPFHKVHRYKPFFLEQLDKTEPPNAPDGHGLSTAVACVLEIVNIVSDIIQKDGHFSVDTGSHNKESVEVQANGSVGNNDSSFSDVLINLDKEKRKLHEVMLDSLFCGFMGTFLLLLDASQEEEMTDIVLEQMNKFAVLYGIYENQLARDCLLLSASKASLPLNYYEVTALSPSFLNFPADFMPKNDADGLPNIGMLSLAMKSNQSVISNAAINLPNLLSKQNSSTANANSCPISSLDNSVGKNSNSMMGNSVDTNRQIIAVGTQLPSLNNQNQNAHQSQGAVMLSSKNLQCMISVLRLAARHGQVFEERSWNIVFTASQHLIWILGLKPTAQGVYQLKQQTQVMNSVSQANISEKNDVKDSGSLITTAAMSDLPVLTTMLSRLFECTKYFDDENLLKIMRTLISLSKENSEVAFHNREPSLFAVVKILECSLVNAQRMDLFWTMITDHLLDLCAHPYNKLREWSMDVLSNLIKEVFSESEIKLTQPQTHYLAPLLQLTEIKFVDIRQKQIDCVTQMLQANGEIFQEGWQSILEVIESSCVGPHDSLVRCAFQCFQFIIGELLKHIPPRFLSNCLNTAAVFGSQLPELNVSLTGIGLIWNIADFLHQNREKLIPALQRKKVAAEIADKGLTVYEGLWLYLFQCLGTLCTDARLSVRKSAAQTLFSTLSTHRNNFGFALWRSIFMYNLFLILNEVEKNSSVASNEKLTQCESSLGNAYQQDPGYIIHYSRNTAFKQWAETQILVLSGVTQMLCQNIDMFVKKNDRNGQNSDKQANEKEDFKDEKTFAMIVSKFFDCISKNAFSSSPEVSTSALKSFGEFVESMVHYCKVEQNSTMNGEKSDSSSVLQEVWRICWRVWHEMGEKCDPSKVLPIENGGNGSDGDSCMEQHSRVLLSQYPQQPFLVLLIKPISHIFLMIDTFDESDFKMMSFVLQNAVATPFLNEPSVYHYYYSSGDPRNITHLQIEVMAFLDRLQAKILSDLSKHKHLVPLLFYQYLALSLYAVNIIPPHLDTFIGAQFQHRFFPGELTSFNTTSFYLLGERAMKNAYQLYQKTHSEENVVKNQILHSLIKSYKIPLCFKYSCPLQTTWKFAVGYFVKTLEIGLPLARAHPDDYMSIWADLAMTFEGFLFPVNKPPTNQALEEQQLDEALDVTVVELIRDQIMLYASSIPKEFLLQIVSLLNRGSIHSPTLTSSIETEVSIKLREEFAKMCFQVLLRFSFFGPKGNPELFIQKGKLSSPEHSIGIVNKLAVASILKRFKDVIINFCQDERICPFPLPRHRLSEISFVLKALATLVSSLKMAPKDSVEDSVWSHLIEIYPSIVDCTMSNSPQVNRSIREVLHEYSYLLRAPDMNESISESINSPSSSNASSSASERRLGNKKLGRNKQNNNNSLRMNGDSNSHSK